MRDSPNGSGSRKVLICGLLLAAGLLFLAGCTATSPPGGAAPTLTPTPTGLQSKIVHVTGKDHGVILLVGRSTCPWCAKDKELLANLSVDYYWVDLNILDQVETVQLMDSIGICGQTSAVPILVINGQTCIIGYQEEKIREAVA
jgi:glutaredoxin-like protein NrdH